MVGHAGYRVLTLFQKDTARWAGCQYLKCTQAAGTRLCRVGGQLIVFWTEMQRCLRYPCRGSGWSAVVGYGACHKRAENKGCPPAYLGVFLCTGGVERSATLARTIK